MQTRMGDRLSFSVTAAPDVESCSVSPALVMTLAENAIKHGIDPAENGGRIEVKARLARGNLLITVADTGVGLTLVENNEHGSGMGLSNIAQRLHVIYGGAAQVRLEQNAHGGCVATFTLPVARNNAA